MPKRWILLIDEYSEKNKKAINMLCGTFSGYLDYVLPVKLSNRVSDKQLKNSNVLVLAKTENAIIKKCIENKLFKTPQQEQGYSVFVGKSIFNDKNQMIVLAAFDDAGLLYAVTDFCNKYCGDILYKGGNLWNTDFFDKPFNREIPEWNLSTVPAVKTRAIWTWGHVIYDYRKFLDNMARLKLNQIVIWNDVVPLNANDIVEYAHSLSIKVIWGFAWGWTTKCKEALSRFDEQGIQKLKSQVLDTYKREYLNTKGDGIYFQSFTEMQTDSVDGVNVAETVVDLVNSIGGELLCEYPDLHIQFGLHATSVKTRLDTISRVDKRIHIIWEDCGAFPYSYWPDDVDEFEDTLYLTERLATLRGDDEKFGAVLKGMLKLDWDNFEHFKDSYILGERTNEYIKNRQIEKNKIWKNIQASWIKNADCLRRCVDMATDKNKEAIFQALVEDSMFENQIVFPVALYAEILCTPNENVDTLKELVAKYPCVYFANL